MKYFAQGTTTILWEGPGWYSEVKAGWDSSLNAGVYAWERVGSHLRGANRQIKGREDEYSRPFELRNVPEGFVEFFPAASEPGA